MPETEFGCALCFTDRPTWHEIRRKSFPSKLGSCYEAHSAWWKWMLASII